jgi:hypothetical protein
MPRSTVLRALAAIIAAIVLIPVLAVGAVAIAGRTETPIAAPTIPPIVEPSVTPTSPTSTPIPAPSDAPDAPVVVDLDVSDRHDVSVAVDDHTGRIVRVSSGTAGDGMSVRWSDIDIINLDARTLQVTFVGYPQDEVIGLGFAVAAGDGFNLAITQHLPLPNTDALGADRVVVLEFSQDVDAEDVYASFAAA